MSGRVSVCLMLCCHSLGRSLAGVLFPCRRGRLTPRARRGVVAGYVRFSSSQDNIMDLLRYL